MSPKPVESSRRYGLLHEYGEGDEKYLLSGVDPSNSVLMQVPFNKRFTHEAGTYGWRTRLIYNISALLVMLQFWWRYLIERPKTPAEAKKLLNRCRPWGYPRHSMADQIRQHTQGTAALVPIYDRVAIFPQLRSLSGGEEEFLDEYDQPEALDVTNRLIATAEAGFNHLHVRYEAGQRHFVIGSIASGSSRAPLDAAYRFKRYLMQNGLEEVTFEFHFVDTNENALQSSWDSARLRGFTDVHLYCMSASDFFSYAKKKGLLFIILEMVGLADYPLDDKAISYHANNRQMLDPHGIYITAHINKTKWAFSVKWRTGWWGLRRRTPDMLRRHLVRAGFFPQYITLEITPACGAHTVAVARLGDPLALS